MSADPTIAPDCTCVRMCNEPDGCCTSCGGVGQDFGCQGMCWDCRGIGHTHPLDDPECPEHRMTYGPPPAPAPDARSVWCAECDGPSDVVEESVVTRLDCGHSDVSVDDTRAARTIHVEIPHDAPADEVEAFDSALAEFAHGWQGRSQWDPHMWSHTESCDDSDHCHGSGSWVERQIAAKALREFADNNVKAQTAGRMAEDLHARADELSRRA